MSKKDTISQLKEEKAKLAKNAVEQNDDEAEDNEEEQNKESEAVVKEQTSSNVGKARNLRELLGDKNEEQAKLPSKNTKQQPKKGKDGKPQYFNSNKKTVSTGYNPNAKNEGKPTFTNSKKVGEKVMEAPKTKSYLEKVPEKKDYQEDVAKPEFKGLREEGQEKFQELSTGEDLFLRNIQNKEVTIKNEYKPDDKGEKRTEKRKHFKKDNYKRDNEPKNDEDSDGFEIVGTKEEKIRKKQEYNRSHQNYNNYRGGFHGKRRGGRQDWGKKREKKDKKILKKELVESKMLKI